MMLKKLSLFSVLLPVMWLGLTAGSPGYWKPETPASSENSERRIVLPLNKAKIIDLPADASDVLISNPEIAEGTMRTPRRAYLVGNAIGQANAFFLDKDGKQILNLEIRVERDHSELSAMIRKFMPDTRITIEAVNDNIVLSGSAPNVAQADRARDLAGRFVGDPEKVLSMISVDSGEQVMLKVRVIEMQRLISKQFGIDMDALYNTGGSAVRLLNTNPFSILNDPLSDTNLGGSFRRNDFDLDFNARVLEQTGLIRTLAEPTLTAISGETANFLAGGEFPVPIGRDRDGNVTIEYKPFGIGLGFTPLVIDPGRISMKISTEVSDVSQDEAFEFTAGVVTDDEGNPTLIPGTTIPSISVRRAETTVELPSGGSLVMAGLLADQLKHNLDGIPGIKDMPIFGALARSRDFQNDQTELVIIVTPYLAGPVQEKQLATPNDGFIPGGDLDTILFGRLNAVYGKKDAALSKQKLNGPHGYIVK